MLEEKPRNTLGARVSLQMLVSQPFLQKKRRVLSHRRLMVQQQYSRPSRA